MITELIEYVDVKDYLFTAFPTKEGWVILEPEIINELVQN